MVGEADAPHQPAQRYTQRTWGTGPGLVLPTLAPDAPPLPAPFSSPSSSHFGPSLLELQRTAVLPAICGGHMDGGILILPLLPVMLLQAEEFLTL